MSYKVFSNGNVLNASELNEFLMNQSVIAFSNATARSSAITSPIEGMITYLEDSNSYQSWDGSAWVGLVPQSPNAIINGAFDIWQRGTSFTGFSGGFVFTSDRWAMFNNGTGTQTVSRQTFTPGDSPVSGAQFYLRNNFATVGTSTGFNLQNRIEDVRTFAGQSVAWSFWARGSNTQNVGLNLTQNFGTGGSSQVDTVSGLTAVLTTTWTRYNGTITVPSISGKTIGANSFLALVINGGGSVKTGDIDIVGVQLEAGPVATPFRRNANSLQGELAACQRYYYRLTSSNGGFGQLIPSGYFTSTTNFQGFLTFPVTMRTHPSSVEFSTVQVVDSSNSTFTASNIALSFANPYGTGFDVTVAGATAARFGYARQNNSTSAFIGVNAEL